VEAADLLGQARRTALRLGAPPAPPRRRAGRATQASLPVPGDRAPGPLDGLSARERQVLALLTEGGTNRAIAAELTLSVRTVDMHVHVLSKLDCRSRAEAVARGIVLSGGAGVA
jgi:DNA-binding NarL/FixJ family response regulator